MKLKYIIYLVILAVYLMTLPLIEKFKHDLMQYPRDRVVVGVCLVLIVTVLYPISGVLTKLICKNIGFIYPASCSIMVLVSPRKSDDTQWLTYWVVYATLSTLELPFDSVIAYFFPIYSLAKAAFLTWCYIPSSNNCADVYNYFIKPRFKQLETQKDFIVEEVTNKISDKYHCIGHLFSQIKVGYLALLALYLIFGTATEFICNNIGFIYPAYCSIMALESPWKSDKTQWLTYWVVYAVLSILVLPFELLILQYFPIYWWAKTVFLLWCYRPSPSDKNGAEILYNCVIRPP